MSPKDDLQPDLKEVFEQDPEGSARDELLVQLDHYLGDVVEVGLTPTQFHPQAISAEFAKLELIDDDYVTWNDSTSDPDTLPRAGLVTARVKATVTVTTAIEFEMAFNGIYRGPDTELHLAFDHVDLPDQEAG